MDAFSVSVCKGLQLYHHKIRDGFVIASYFGLFQALMPFLGYLLGSSFAPYIVNVDHWIIFGLLNYYGINMLRKKTIHSDYSLHFSSMFPLAIATSLDSFAVGISFSFLSVSILFSIVVIGMITFFLSFMGVVIGNNIGQTGERFSTILGGILLILTGFRILFVHLRFF